MENKTNKQSLPDLDSILVAFFSFSGNTRSAAMKINEIVGGDMFEIKRVKAYPDSYNSLLNEAKHEIRNGEKPAIIDGFIDTQKYNVVFIGYPNWWNTFPAPVNTFLSRHDLSNKTIIPFCTHGGGGIGNSAYDIRSICSNSNVDDGIEISRHHTNFDKPTILNLLEPAIE